MQRYEYKVVPAPRRGEKARGVKSTEDRFALAMTHLMNDLGADGWEYLRADTLPCDERVGLTGSKTTYQNLLVFRRVVSVAEGADAVPAPRLVALDTVPPAPAVRLGGAAAPAGPAPALGPATPGVAAE